MKKHLLILKQSSTKITVFKEHLEIKTLKESYIVAFRHIEAIYLNKAIRVDISTCWNMAKKVPLFLTDHNGYILAQLKEYQ